MVKRQSKSPNRSKGTRRGRKKNQPQSPLDYLWSFFSSVEETSKPAKRRKRRATDEESQDDISDLTIRSDITSVNTNHSADNSTHLARRLRPVLSAALGLCVLLSAYHMVLRVYMSSGSSTTGSSRHTASVDSMSSQTSSSSFKNPFSVAAVSPVDNDNEDEDNRSEISADKDVNSDNSSSQPDSSTNNNNMNNNKSGNDELNKNELDWDFFDKSNDWRQPGELRFDWLNMPVRTNLAKMIKAHNERCDLPVYNWQQRNEAGMGSDLHLYTFALCHAHQNGRVLNSARPWMYEDGACDLEENGGKHREHAMDCYFPGLDNSCAEANGQPASDLSWRDLDPVCASLMPNGLDEWQTIEQLKKIRSAFMEYMFSHLSPLVVNEAKRQHALVFPDGAPPSHQIVTVHIRWGDKKQDMRLKGIDYYINTVKDETKIRGLKPDEVTVFLATEDPKALEAFKAAMDPQWKLHVDQFYWDYLPHRGVHVADEALHNKDLHIGLKVLASLLVSMEADTYVLGTGSNWSRAMEELRRGIVETRCPPQNRGPCTSMRDVAPTQTRRVWWDY